MALPNILQEVSHVKKVIEFVVDRLHEQRPITINEANNLIREITNQYEIEYQAYYKSHNFCYVEPADMRKVHFRSEAVEDLLLTHCEMFALYDQEQNNIEVEDYILEYKIRKQK